MGFLDPILSKLPGGLGRKAKMKAKNATQKTANQAVNKTFQ